MLKYSKITYQGKHKMTRKEICLDSSEENFGRPDLLYNPKGKVFFLIKDCYALGFKIARKNRDGTTDTHMIFEYDKSCRRYIPKNRLGEKLVTLSFAYTRDQIKLFVAMGLVSSYGVVAKKS